MSYVTKLSFISEDQARLEGWRDWYGVWRDADCFTKALITQNFRYLMKSNSEYWRKEVRSEGLYLSVLGLFFPRH